MQLKVFSLIIVSLATFSSMAQKGNNEFSINVEVAIPGLQDEHGFGGFIKYLYGIGNSDQLTISGGLTKLSSTDSSHNKSVIRMIPFLFGYKKNISRWNIEPRIGIGELGGKIPIDGDYSRPSVAAFYYGIGAGYSVDRFNFGINFLAARGIDGSAAGTWHDQQYHYTNISLGYSIFATTQD